MVNNTGNVAVYGATGHTGKFVVNALRRRGLPVIAVGRDVSGLSADLAGRTARIDDAAALDRAFAGCAVVINCAGPFLDTATPIIEAALRVKCSYIDVTAEQSSAKAVFDDYHELALAAGITLVPAAGFYGGLADLLATALAGGGNADEITTAIALDHWWPTEGTRITGARNSTPRMIVVNGKLVPMLLPAQKIDWAFDLPFGVQPMVALPFSEIVTMGRHLSVGAINSFLSTAPLEELRDTATRAPVAVDAQGRSAQRFMMEVVVANAHGKHHALATGQDIYAVSAPIVVEAAARILDPSFNRHGALALGQAFDARDFLNALSPADLVIEFAAA